MSAHWDPYEDIAAYYDMLHASLNDDIGLVLSLAAKGAPVLELGCGTGRLILPLVRAGYAVTGVDRSLPMLLRAKEHIAKESVAVRERIQLLCADMVDFALADARFKLALIPYNTLMHLDHANAVAACRNIRRHLAPGGRLFIDIVNPLLVEQTPNDQQLSLERTFTDTASGELVVVMAANELDAGRQILNITWLFDASSQRGGYITRRVARIMYHYYYPHQLELVIQEAELELVALYGSYRQEPYGEDSERLLLLARRAS